MDISRGSANLPEMNVTEKALADFRTWLLDQGRSDGTADLYVSNVRRASEHGNGLAGPLVDKDLELAPKTKHTYRAALRMWAKYAEDADLEKRLERIKMPPARRAGVKVPLEREDWRRLIAATRDADLRTPIRCVILIMAKRGLRSGDVMRLRKREIVDGLARGHISLEVKGGRRVEYAVSSIREELQTLLDQDREWQRVEDLCVGPRCRSTGPRRRVAAQMAVRRGLIAVADRIHVDGVHPHRLRRSYATFFLQELKGDPQAIIKLQRHMGWDSLATAAGYVDAVDRDELDQVADNLIRTLE